MANHRPDCLMIGQERKRQLFRYFMVQGHGGPLLLLWSIGTSLFLFLFGLPIYAVVWTVMVILLGIWMMRAYRGNPKVWEQLLRSAMDERFPRHTLSDRPLQVIVQKSADLFVQIALKVYGLGRADNERAELNRVLAAAHELLSLQYGLARRAKDLAHGLTIVDPDCKVGADLITEAPDVRRGTVDAVQKEADQDRTLAGEIGQHLETLLLWVFQLEKLLNTAQGAAELAREMEATMARAQAKVDSLHQPMPLLADHRVPPELRRRLESLQHGFSRNELTQGLEALQQLAYEYTQLQSLLERRKGDQSLLVAHIPALAEESYRQGLSVIEHAQELEQATRPSDRERLESEVIQLEREIQTLTQGGGQGTRRKVLEETLASHRERLRLMERQSLRVEELLYQAGRCEASLNRARLELLSLSADGSQGAVDAVTETLRRVIQQTRDVQEELKELGF